MCWMSICLVGSHAHSEVLREDAPRLAQLNVRHHLIPGVKLNAKNETSTVSSTAKSPAVPPPPPTQKRKDAVTWPSECSEPVKVSFYGDYWVSPKSPAAQLKGSLFDQLQPLLQWADFNVVNFEGALTREEKRAFEKFPFALKQAPDSLKWLGAAGIKYFTLANNHAMDFGWKGAQDTMSAIQAAGMKHAGLGANLRAALQPMWLEKSGIRIAVISATTTFPAEAWAADRRPGVAFPRADAIRKAIAEARRDADFVVVAFHWGEELKPTLRDHQPAQAKIALEAGADIIVGHHAHLAQVVDIEPENGLIVYGLGNFTFASLSREAKFGLGAHFEFCKSAMPDADGATHSYRMVLTPLQTFNRTTGYRTRAMSLSEFAPFAREYVKKGYFSSELEFFIPGENQVRTISEWLQPSAQASKEGTAVR
ncbi:MAG: hypothetical protein RI932_1366 [Pseudomonadota bacterium]|jgi:hypothetical protein